MAITTRSPPEALYRPNFWNFTRLGTSESVPRRRFLSSR